MRDIILEKLKNWRPIGDRVVVLPEEQKKLTDSDIITSDTKQGEDKSIVGTIIAVGPGRYMENGQIQPMENKVGETVLFGKYSGEDFLVDENKIEKYNGVKRDDQVLVTVIRQDLLLAILPS